MFQLDVGWLLNVDPSGHFDYSYVHIYQSNVDYFVVDYFVVDYFVVESITMVIN